MNLRGNDMDTKNQDKYRGMMLDGRYELVELIGSGGMAVVYKAMCHRLNRYVAVKIMRPELAKNEKFRRRFQTESQAIAKLSHPNIVGVYDVSRTDHVEYIVMELVDGITLKQYLQDHGPLDAVQAVDFSLQIARALAHAHGKGIVHRDIKPQNILVVNDGVIKVADFGIANLQSEVPDVENEAIGSVHYISPEQARGLPVDGRSDIYSLGIVMYEMLSGKLPFDGDDDRTVALKHLSAVPTPLHEIAPSVPEALEKIVMKAMEASLDNRYQTADALAADLEALQKSLTGSLDRIEGNVAPLSTAGELGREDYVRRRRRAHRVSMLSGFFGVMAAILIIAVFLWNYFLSDIFVVNQRVAIPNFVGSNYETIINSKEFKGKYNFDLIYEIDPNVERGIIIGQSRQTYALARCKCLPGFLGKLDKNGTPINALLTTSVIGIVLTLIGSVDVIVVIANMGSAFMALCCFISWIKLAKDQPDMPRPYKCPRWLGYIGIPFCLIVAFCSLYSAVTAGTLFYIAVAIFVIAMLYYAAVCKKKNGTFLVEPEDQ